MIQAHVSASFPQVFPQAHTMVSYDTWTFQCIICYIYDSMTFSTCQCIKCTWTLQCIICYRVHISLDRVSFDTSSCYYKILKYGRGSVEDFSKVLPQTCYTYNRRFLKICHVHMIQTHVIIIPMELNVFLRFGMLTG